MSTNSVPAKLKLKAKGEGNILWNADSDEAGPIGPDSLPVSEELKTELQAWADQYENFASPEAETQFNYNGFELQKKLESELPNIMVIYVPRNLTRFSTGDAINKLAERFNLEAMPEMQDWAIEVASPELIDDFIKCYQNEAIDDDQKFTLMEMLLQSFDEMEGDLGKDPRWVTTLKLLQDNLQLHIFTVWHWVDWDGEIGGATPCDPFLKALLSRNKNLVDTCRQALTKV